MDAAVSVFSSMEKMMPRPRKYEIRKIAIVTVLMVTLFAAARLAQAEVIYRSTNPDGEITYSSQPVPGARESRAIEYESLSPAQRRAILLLRQREREISAEISSELKALEAKWQQADQEIVETHKTVANAEDALQKGRTPLAYEWIGNVSGGSRLKEAYFQRLQHLETRVEKAKERLDRAYAARNALK